LNTKGGNIVIGVHENNCEVMGVPENLEAEYLINYLKTELLKKIKPEPLPHQIHFYVD